MNPDYAARINSARSPDELKAALVESLAELWAAIERQPADPWASGWGAPATRPQWDDHNVHMQAQREFKQQVEAKRYATEEEANAARLQARIAANPVLGRHIAAIEEALVTATGEEEVALAAKLKLLKEGGAQPVDLVEEGVRPIIASDGNEGIVDFAAVSMERKAQRYAWAKEHRLWEFITLDEDAACETFAKGGPMWLYLNEGGRDAILAMPPDWRAWLISEVQLDSPREAQMMGRDLMKQEDALDPDNSPSGQAALSRAREA